MPIPYRGQPEPKSYGHPFLPDPNEKRHTLTFWSVAAVIGMGIAYFASRDKTGITAFGLVIYLSILIVIFFASRDAQNSPQRSQPDGQGEQNSHDRPSLAADYFDQLEWNLGHRRKPLSSRGGSLEPEWRYQPVQAHSKAGGFGCLSALAMYTIPLLVLAVVMYVVFTFGIDSPVTLGILFVFGMIGVVVLITAQELRDGPGIVLQKHRAKELGHKMSKHSRK